MLEQLGYVLESEDEYCIIYTFENRHIVFMKESKTLMLPCNLTIQEFFGIAEKLEEFNWNINGGRNERSVYDN